MAFMSMIKGASGGGDSGDNDFTIIDAYAISRVYSNSYTINNMAGKKILILAYDWISTSYQQGRFDGVTTNDGSTITKLTNLVNSAAQVAGTFYQVDVASNSCVIRANTGINAAWVIIGAD